ncbi:hypothetical protein KFE25_004832 [Diacronema lutheri]|uniref:F-box domain-containing protein n=1 Tax=Diacronema lutheri TaxID=2081491 RepID=A0A8J5XD23_DIALT|nr:hypothetical protein KFE25_004832 [Diacronema lutheri]
MSDGSGEIPPLDGVDAQSLRLLERYIANLLHRSPLVRRIRTTNAAFRRMDARAIAVLTCAKVGYARAVDEAGEGVLRLERAPSATALERVAESVRAELAARPALDSLPADVLARVLGHLRATELCAAVTASRALARCAADARLFARFCEPARRRALVATLDARADCAALPGEADSAPSAYAHVDWRRVHLAECLWRRACARAPPALRASVRAGADPARVLSTARSLALPRDVVASLLVADGQNAEGARCGSFIGGGLRLLSLAEIEDELRAAGECASAGALEIPLTARDGPLQLLVRAEAEGGVRAEGGSVWIAAGFGRARKAGSWLALLDRLESDVV